MSQSNSQDISASKARNQPAIAWLDRFENDDGPDCVARHSRAKIEPNSEAVSSPYDGMTIQITFNAGKATAVETHSSNPFHPPVDSTARLLSKLEDVVETFVKPDTRESA